MPVTPELKQRLREFYSRLEDRPLEPNDPFYEPSVARLHNGGDPIEALRTRISWSEAASVHMLSGQRGSGKSTELRRLRVLLKEEGCEVLLCDMRDYMNMTKPVEITDFLISVMGALSDSVKEAYKEDFSREGYWSRLVNFLNSEVDLKELKLEANAAVGKVGISASLKEDTTFKRRIQEQLRGHVARVVEQAHGFAAEVVSEIRRIRKDPNKKVVLLVDSVEQLRGVGPDEADAVYKSVENLFSGHSDALKIPSLHVVYTIPPYLIPLAPGLGRVLGGGTISNLPSVRVKKRDGSKDPEGLAFMENIMSRRRQGWKDVFTQEQIHRMALNTGGDLRDFLRLVKDCLVKAATASSGALPIEDKIITDAENHLRRDMLPIAREDLEWLRRISKSKQPELERIQELPHLA